MNEPLNLTGKPLQLPTAIHPQLVPTEEDMEYRRAKHALLLAAQREFEEHMKGCESLPFALRTTYITDEDVEAMLRVARGQAESGKYLRTPKRVEEAKRGDIGDE